VKLCASVAVLLSLPPAGAGCSKVFVPATGVDKRWLPAASGRPGAERPGGGPRNGTLAVNRVEPFTPDCRHASRLCRAPRRRAVALVMASRTVTKFCRVQRSPARARPQTYTDLWGHGRTAVGEGATCPPGWS
jgi:hypothetical protein